MALGRGMGDDDISIGWNGRPELLSLSSLVLECPVPLLWRAGASVHLEAGMRAIRGIEVNGGSLVL